MSLQEKMIAYRATHGLSMEKAAKNAGVCMQTWRSVEIGIQTPSSTVAYKIKTLVEKEDEPGESKCVTD